MPSVVLTSELEAVNTMLAAAGEAPVLSLALTGLLTLDRAIATLDETSRLVQSTGWSFNTEYDYPLTRNGSLEIPLPNNTLKCDVDNDYASYKAQARGLYLYNGKTRLNTFDRDLEATMVFLLGWDSLPQAARHYIMIRASRAFQGRDFGSDSADRFTEYDEVQALLALQDYESATGNHNMIYDSWSTYKTIHGIEGEGY